MRILAIETSCDETALALLEAKNGLKSPKFKILKNLIASQIEIHRPWGGVVPNLAKREHIKNLPILYQKIFKNKIPKIDLLAVTIGPGLEPCLWSGISFSKKIYKELKAKNPKIKLIGVNHLEGHLFSFLLNQKNKNSKIKTINSNLFPAVSLLVSGGHTILLLMNSLTQWQKLGETRDDAVGEAFDKVAKMLNLSYPGGPEIEKLAKKGNPEAIKFPRPMIYDKSYDFSYSGLKTAVLYYLKDHKQVKKEDVAASFQQAALEVLVQKTKKAVEEFKAKSIVVAGGVAANKELRKKLKTLSKSFNINFFAPPLKFNTDNAVMIGVAGYINILSRKNHFLTAQANMEI